MSLKWRKSFTTHFNGLEGLQQSHGRYPINHQWFVTNIVDQKCTYWTKRVFTPYWKKNLSSARRREDQMMTNFVKHHWWLIGHHPWDCWSPSSPLEWVVKRFFSTPWQNKIEKRQKFKSYFICKMALKPPKVETGILGFEYFASWIAGNWPSSPRLYPVPGSLELKLRRFASHLKILWTFEIHT